MQNTHLGISFSILVTLIVFVVFVLNLIPNQQIDAITTTTTTAADPLTINNVNNNPLVTTVIYYGNLVSDQESISKIKWPVLGIFGDQDQSISVNEVKNFEKMLTNTKIPNEIYIYEGVGHASANPSGDNYAPQETQDAWKKTLDFLNKYL
jgi:dienelactone hydrolase